MIRILSIAAFTLGLAAGCPDNAETRKAKAEASAAGKEAEKAGADAVKAGADAAKGAVDGADQPKPAKHGW